MSEPTTNGVKPKNKLPVSERLYKAVVDNFFDTTGLLDARGNVIYQSDASSGILGLGHGERVGKNAFELMHPDDIPRVKKLFSKLVASPGLSDKTELRYRHANGQWIYLEAFVTNLLDDKDVNGMLFSYRDITDKKNIEEELNQSNRIFKTLVDTLHEGVVRVDNRDVILYVNDQFCQLTGYLREELLGQTAKKLLIEESELPRFEEIMKVRNQGVSSSYELCIIRKNGKRAWLLVSGSPFYDLDGNLTGSVGVHFDITERKEFEQQLKLSEAKYQQLTELSPVGIFNTDLEGNSIYANDKWCKISGLTKEESNKDGWLKAVHPDDREMVSKEWNDAIKNQRSSRLEYRYLSPAGKITWVFGQAVLEKDAEGNIIGYVGTVTDITIQKETAQLNARREKVLEALATGNSLEQILESIVEMAEKSRPGMICSILLLDRQNNRLSVGMAPNLPGYINKMAEGVEPGKGVGSCGEAAYTGKTVIAEDIFSHPNWADKKIRTTFEKAGLKACWSEPIFSSHGDVIGTLAMYFRQPCKPDQSDFNLLRRIAYVAGIAIERKIAEDELLKSERRTKALLQGVPDMIFHFSKQGDYLAFSPGIEVEPYVHPETLIGKNLKQVLPPGITSAYMRGIKKAIKTKQVQMLEYTLGDWKNKDKSIFYECRIIAIDNDEIISMVRDVTERKQTEEAIRKSEQRNRALLEGVPEMIFSVTKDGRFLDFKPGHDFDPLAKPEDFLGAKIQDVLPPEIATTALRLIKHALRDRGVVKSFEYSLPDMQKTGAVKYFESRIIASGPEEVIVLVSDITHRKQSEIALLKSEERWRSMVENAPNFIAILDQHQNITFLNRINNLDTNNLIGRKAYLTIDKKYRTELKKVINRVIENCTLQNLEFSSTGVDGEKKWWAGTFAPLLDPEGTSKVIAMAYDITEQKNTEYQLKLSNQKLNRLNNRLETIREEEKKTIAMEIHDELGQELTALKLGMFWMQQYINNKNSQPDLNVILNKIEALIELCGQTINSVRRIAHQLRPVILDNLGLIPAIEWHINLLNQNDNIKHVFHCHVEDKFFGKEFSTALFRIIQESLTNVSRHSNAKKAFIKLYKTDDQLILQIKDNGIGIDEQAMNQAGKIGIFGIKERIKNWNGKFYIKGLAGKGTTLKMSFPLKAIGSIND